MTHYGSSLPVFHRDIRQEGYRLGEQLMQFAAPLIKPIARTVGKDPISERTRGVHSLREREAIMNNNNNKFTLALYPFRQCSEAL